MAAAHGWFILGTMTSARTDSGPNAEPWEPGFHADLEDRLATRLDPISALQSWEHQPSHLYTIEAVLTPEAPSTSAAVLMPIVRRPEGWTLLLTQRTATMPTHAGQVAFPGGRRQAEDQTPIDAALREAFEETGIPQNLPRVIGGLPQFLTGTNFMITPVAAFLEPGFPLAPDPREVDEVFETPLSFLFNPANHERRSAVFQGVERSFYAMPYGRHYIWGVTAAIIRGLYERLYL
ncbi:MAG: CoA pyrophosphatase [Caulobacterales bacterium]